MAGDEIYLIITNDLIPAEMNIESAALEVLASIDEFFQVQGSNLCVSFGFPPLTSSIGINIGIGWIISDSISVRTSGNIVNHAKRLQEEAGKDGILARSLIGLDLKGSNYAFGDEILIQKKKQIIPAQKLLRLKESSMTISHLGLQMAKRTIGGGMEDLKNPCYVDWDRLSVPKNHTVVCSKFDISFLVR